jgi:hypothetical protein
VRTIALAVGVVNGAVGAAFIINSPAVIPGGVVEWYLFAMAALWLAVACA